MAFHSLPCYLLYFVTSSLENSPCMLVTREAENTGIIHLLGNTLCRHMNMHIVTGFWHNLSKKGWYSMYPPLLLRFWSMGIWLWQLWENGPNDHFFVTVRKMNPSPRKKKYEQAWIKLVSKLLPCIFSQLGVSLHRVFMCIYRLINLYQGLWKGHSF